MKDFVSLKFLSKQELISLLSLTQKIKRYPSKFKSKLKGKTVGLLFEKPSLRTKTAFYLGAFQLGAEPVYYSPQEVKLGERENISDVAKTLSCYLDCVVLRTFSHKIVLDFAHYSSIPVVNGLSDLLHPSQVLSDLFTLQELKKDLKKIKVSYIGDGNNVCHSLIYAFSLMGGNLNIATPSGYEPEKEIWQEGENFAKANRAKLNLYLNPEEAIKDADVVYTDVWASMGQEGERKKRLKVFKKYQVNEKILKLAKKDCLVMHCLPAHRGEEITDSVIDGSNSVVFLQAENRLHTAKAILLYLLGGKFKKKSRR